MGKEGCRVMRTRSINVLELEWLKRLAAAVALCMLVPRTSGSSPDPATIVERRYEKQDTPATGEFWLLADSQLHNVSAGSAFLRSKLMDKHAPSAIRPPSLDLWSGSVLHTILSEMRSASVLLKPIFFLGDATDISCTGEFADFLRTMDSASGQTSPAGLPWFAVLGNHDGYYEGNLTLRPDKPMNPRDRESFAIPGDKTWSGACYASQLSVPERHRELMEFERRYLIQSKNSLDTHTEQKSLSKATAVLMYLDSLWRRGVLRADPLQIDSWSPPDTISDRGNESAGMMFYRAEGQYTLGKQTLPIQIHASVTIPPSKIRDDYQWRAHVVQDVQLPDGTHALLLDTSDPSFTPPSKYRYLFPKASKQLDLLPKEWQQLQNSCHSTSKITFPGVCGEISSLQRASVASFMKRWSPGTRFFVMGHHPLESFRLSSERGLQGLFQVHGFISYISGHTHYPASTAPALGAPNWEINIGSTTDWPIHYSIVSYWNTTSSHRLQVDIRVPQTLAQCPYSDTEYELDYGNVHKYVARALSAYQRLFKWMRDNVSIAELDDPSRISKFTCRAQGCVAHFEHSVSDALATRDIYKRRRALAEVVQYDRDVLRSSVNIRDVQAACAMWASQQDFIDRNSPRQTIEAGELLPLTGSAPFLPPTPRPGP
jgi:hypothetical protein